MENIIIIIAVFSTLYTLTKTLIEVKHLYRAIKDDTGLVQKDKYHTAEHIGILLSISVFVVTWLWAKTNTYYANPTWELLCFYFIIFFNILFTIFVLEHFKKERIFKTWTPFNTKI